MAKKKKKGKSSKKIKSEAGPKVPPLHELWDLESLHSQYESGLSEIGTLKLERSKLEDELNTLKNDHSVVFEKFQQEFDDQKRSTISLMEKASESEKIRIESEKKNEAKIRELENFVRTAKHTVTKISAEWKAKLGLIREAETAVVRNAQLEIENSQLNREKVALKEELKKRESQIFVVQKGGLNFKDEEITGEGGTLESYTFKSNQEGGSDVVKKAPDDTVALAPMILESMKQFPDNMKVQCEAVEVLSFLTENLEHCNLLGRFFGVELVMRAMRNYMQRPRMQVAGAKLLWRMSSLNVTFFDKVKGSGGVQMALYSMKLRPHDESRTLVYSLARLLKALTMEQLVKLQEEGIDGLFRIEEGDGKEGKKKTDEELRKMFPRVNRKRERLAAEAERRKGKKRGGENEDGGGGLTLPKILMSDMERKNKKKRNSVAGKRRSLLLVGVEDEDKDVEMEKEEKRGGEKEIPGSISEDDSVGLSLMGAGGGDKQIAGNFGESSAPNEGTGKVAEWSGGIVSSAAVVGGLVNEGRSVMKTLLVTLSYCVDKIKEEVEQARNTAAKEEEAMKGSMLTGGIFSEDDPSSSSPSMVGWGGRGSTKAMHKVSSMPVMGKHAVLVRHEREANQNSSDSDDSDYGEDTVGSYVEGEEFKLQKNGKGGARRSSRKRGKTKGGKSKEEEEEEEITSANTFKSQSFKEAARDCLINCVMAIDTDLDGGCAGVVSYKSAQKIIVSALDACKEDPDAVAAACMLIRGSLKSGAKQRMKQTTFVMECGLSEAISDVLRIHQDQVMTGKVMDECQAMIEGLGNQFERTLRLVDGE